MVHTTERIPFDIREHLDKLTPAKGKNHYICPVCGGNNLTIEPNTGKYHCWNGCECKDIREAISPWEQAKGISHQLIGSRKPKPKPKAKLPTPAPIPEIPIELATLPEFAIHPERRKRGEHRIEIEYPYSDRQWVLRVETQNPEGFKGYDKVTIPFHLNAEGKNSKGKGDEPWNPYRIEEVGTYGAGKWVLGVEGEACVEAARFLGLVAFTLQGASWTEADLNRAMLQCKTAGVVGVVYFPDHDQPGYKKAQSMLEAATKTQLPFILADPTLIWPECPSKGDIADWAKWGMEQGWDKEEFVRKLEAQFNAAAERERLRQDIENDDWDDSGDDIPGSFNPRAEFTQFTLEALYGDKPWICADDKLYHWAGTHYKHSKDAIEIKRLADWCNSYAVPSQDPLTGKVVFRYPFAKPSKVKQALEWIKMRLSVDPDLINPEGLNCTNGVLQIEWNIIETQPIPHWRLIDHSPELYYTYEPLVKYDPEADSEACDRLLKVLDAPQQDIFLKTVAASLDLPTIRKHKGRLVRGLLLKGHGSNGKDTLREAVSMMHGRQGMTGCTLSDFGMYDEGRKFPLARLRYSRCNWASENANTTRLDKIQSLKAFITGDTLSAEGKGRDEDEFVPAGIALFNINDTPKLQGTLEAIASRYGVLSFNKTFKIGADPTKGELEADPRFKYDTGFLQEKVLPSFLNRVLDALQRLMTEGIDYSCTQKALEDIQSENSHLFQFCQDVGLVYEPSSVLTAGEIWERLEQWYQDNGTLEYEESSNGKQKAIWSEQANPYDKNVKAPNQVLGRFQQLFPKCKRVTVPHSGGKKVVQGLQGIGFTYIPGGSDDLCDNKPEICTPVAPQCTPVAPQFPPQKTTENQGSHPTHPNFSNSIEKNQKDLIDSGNDPQALQKNSNTPQQLGWVGCDGEKSSILGVHDRGATGVQTQEIGVEAQSSDLSATDVLIDTTASVAITEPLASGDGIEQEVAALAEVLADERMVPNKQKLALIRKDYSRDVLLAACQHLTPERRATIKSWVIELNEQVQKSLVATKPPQDGTPPIKVGSRVRFLGEGSLRYGKVGTVKAIAGEIATVWLDYDDFFSNRHDLRKLESGLGRLELLE
jgi:putative DNA primase/helicase